MTKRTLSVLLRKNKNVNIYEFWTLKQCFWDFSAHILLCKVAHVHTWARYADTIKKEMHSTHNGLEEEDCEEANVNNRAGLNKIPKCLCVSC